MMSAAVACNARYLPPAGDIDWRLQGIDSKAANLHCENNTSSSSPCYVLISHLQNTPDDKKVGDWIRSGGLRDQEQHTFITILTNWISDSRCQGCPTLLSGRNDNSSWDDTASCLFRYLFEPR